MIALTLICVGKLKEQYYKDAVREYMKRLGGYCKAEIIELPETRLADSPTQAQVTDALEKEGDMILRKIPKGAVVAAMCIEGKMSSSEELAEDFRREMIGGASKFVFIIGGSFGLSSKVKTSADKCLSMSKMTFPHHLARVMLLEQVYRAFKIIEGSTYHK